MLAVCLCGCIGRSTLSVSVLCMAVWEGTLLLTPPCLLSLSRHGSRGVGIRARSLASVPSLPPAVGQFVKEAVDECKPTRVHVVTGTPEEAANILAGLERDGMVKKLPKYDNW